MKDRREGPRAPAGPVSFTRDAPRAAPRRPRTKAAKRLAVLAAAGLLVAAFAASGMRAPRDGLPSSGGRSLDIPAIAGVPYYLQKDPAWSSAPLGDRGSTMGGEGCVVCCVAMGVSALGHPMDPGELRSALGRSDGFTDTGLLVWSQVGEATGGAVRVEIPRLGYEVIDAELAAGRPVVAHVMLAGTFPHWVLIVGKDGREYLVVDPLNPMRFVARLSHVSPAIRAIRVFRRG